jgi:hypothetical protein
VPAKPGTARTSTSSSIAAIERHHGPDDPRLPPLREALEMAAAVEEAESALDTFAEFVARAKAKLLPLASDQIASAGRIAAAIDSRPDDRVAA